MAEIDLTLELRRELVFQLIETSRLLHAYVDERARKAGTTRAQWSVLGRLRREDGITQTELAARLELQPISLVRLIDRLVEQGLVERRADPADRRAWRVYLTPDGCSIVEALDPVGHSIRAELLTDLEDDELRGVNAVLVKMKNRLKVLTRSDHASVEEPPQIQSGSAMGRVAKRKKRSV